MYYRTKESAEKALLEIKNKYVSDYDLESVEELETMINDGSLSEFIYSDSYMDIDPFYYSITNCEEDVC